MRAAWFGRGLDVVVGTMLALTITQAPAEAARHNSSHEARHAASSRHGFVRVADFTRHGRRYSWHSGGLQCVPFARENSGIELSGNAGGWWDNASGLYERGARPEVGSVLNFRATGRMRMGHVAVVTNVLSPRHIEIDHANWGVPGRISRNIDVVDVSPDNDWTAVRVALNQAEDYGSTYPTFGFIYDRPDHGTMVANTGIPTSSGQRTGAARIDIPTASAPEEVAEVAADDDGATPRYSSRHRAGHAGRTGTRFAQASRLHGYSPFPTASTYRVSTHLAPAKPVTHKAGKRRL